MLDRKSVLCQWHIAQIFFGDQNTFFSISYSGIKESNIRTIINVLGVMTKVAIWKKIRKGSSSQSGKNKVGKSKKRNGKQKNNSKNYKKKNTKKNKPFFATHSLLFLSSVLLALAFTFKAAYHEGNFQTCSPRTYLVKLNHQLSNLIFSLQLRN